MEKKTVSVIIILFVVALLLGAVIFGQQGRNQQPTAETVPSPEMTWSGKDKPDEVAVLMFPPQNASNEDQQAHRDLVDKLAQKAASIDLTQCTPKPLVFAHTQGESITVKNQDAKTSYVLQFGENSITIPAGKSAVIDSAMIETGNTGYTCHEADVAQPSVMPGGIIRSRVAGG